MHTRLIGLLVSLVFAMTASGQSRPNILLVMSDNQSWLHTGVGGTDQLETPGFDRVAREGALFNHAYAPSPSCTPSRSAVLTGQDIWRLEKAGVLWGGFPSRFDTYPAMLESTGYHVGYTGKGWGPGEWRDYGREENPAGTSYNRISMDAPEGVNRIDYAANFEAFYKDKQDGAPFCFWMGTREPHRPYDEGSGVRDGKSLNDVNLPGFLPAVDEIQSDYLDYYNEIEWQDAHLVRALEFLEAQGELDNTLVVVTSDNGMQIPRGITCLYDYGVRVPLAIRWGAVIEEPRVYDEFVNLIDLAPTFYHLAGVDSPETVTGRNLVPLLESQPGELGGEWRDAVVTGMERHTLCRPGELPYPSRAIRTHEYLYIRNYEPDRWPAGAPDYEAAAQGFYGDVDEGPTKTWFLEQADNPEYAREFALSFGKRPAEELYKLSDDPDQIANLADAPEHADVKTNLKSRMNEYLERTGDPRLNGESPWDRYPYYSNTQRQGKEPVTNPHVIPDD